MEQIHHDDIIVLDPRLRRTVTLERWQIADASLEDLCRTLWETDRHEFWRRALALLKTESLQQVVESLEINEKTLRDWKRKGFFPASLQFGWKHPYWVAGEVEIAGLAFDKRWSTRRRWILTQALMLKRFVLLTQLLHLCDLEAAAKGPDQHQSPEGLRPLKSFCRNPKADASLPLNEPITERFNCSTIPISVERAHNMMSAGTFPVATVRKCGRYLTDEAAVRRAHLRHALYETPLPVIYEGRYFEKPSRPDVPVSKRAPLEMAMKHLRTASPKATR